MRNQITITIPEQFLQVFDFMEITPAIFIQKFLGNILSLENSSGKDQTERIIAICYFLTYSNKRNKVCDLHVRIKQDFITRSLSNADKFLNNLASYRNGSEDEALRMFITDWQTKWEKVIEILSSKDDPADDVTETNENPVEDALSPFESICLDTFAHVVLQRGEHGEVCMDGDDEVASVIKVRVVDKRLWISTEGSVPDSFTGTTLYISYVTLNGLVVNHAGSVTCKEPIETSWLGIVQNSQCTITLGINAMTLDVTLNKTGDVIISGSAEEARIQNNRSAKFDGQELLATAANISVRGSGSVSICAEDELIAGLYGSGDLFYKGAPRLKSLTMKGTGQLKPVEELKP